MLLLIGVVGTSAHVDVVRTGSRHESGEALSALVSWVYQTPISGKRTVHTYLMYSFLPRRTKKQSLHIGLNEETTFIINNY